MTTPSFIISAIGTPLDAEESLHEAGLEQHVEDQWSNGIDGILVAGSMGLMQMLRDSTYRALVQRTTELSRGKGEVLVGVGDAGWSRTCDRIEAVSRFVVDGVVVLTPYLFPFSQQQLIDYFWTLADISPVPLYLYDLPVLAKIAIDVSTYEALAKHPNIKGAKVSGRFEVVQELKQRLPADFRIIVADADKLSVLLRDGMANHLDGMYCIAPHWTVAIAAAVAAQDWDRAAHYQRLMTELRELLVGAPSDMGAFTAMLNARGVSGNYYASPYPALDEPTRLALLAHPVIQELIAPAVASGPVVGLPKR